MTRAIVCLRLALTWALCSCSAECVAAQPDPPPAEVLCKLVLGKTTVEEARRILGPAASITSVGPKTTLVYLYRFIIPERYATLTLSFQADLFVEAVTSNIPYPSCWLRKPGVTDATPAH